MEAPSYVVREAGISRSFSAEHPLLKGGGDRADVLLLIGDGHRLDDERASYGAIGLEIGDEGLGVHTGEDSGREGGRVVGFSRWRLGSDEPSNLIELVIQPQTSADSVALVRAVFEGAGFQVSVCADRPGRIVDRLIRPQFNLALQAIDDGLVTARDLDTCLNLGLGYRNGFVVLLERSGLDDHYDRCMTLYAAYGRVEFMPARRAVVAKARASMGGQKR